MNRWPLLAAALLAGCTNMSGLDGESRYACAAPDGVACDSVSGTYANALQHKLPSQRRAGAATKAVESTDGPAPKSDRRPHLAGVSQSVTDTAESERTPVPLRSTPRVLRLWTKPWEDADGDLWDQGYVYVQVDDGSWQLEHVRQRVRDRYTPTRPPAGTAGTAGMAGSDPQPSAPVPNSTRTSADELGASSAATQSSASTPPNPFGNFPAFNRPQAVPLHRQP